MSGWFNFFSSAPKVADDIFDKDDGLLTQVGEWIGNSEFTNEERSEHNAEFIGAVHAFIIATLDENTDRSKARREIAVFFIKFYAVMLFMTGMVYPIDPGWSMVWFKLATSLSVGGLITAISIFFFGSHAIAKYQAGKDE